MRTATTRGVLAVIAVLVLATFAGAAPSARDILRRVLTVNSGSPDIASADVVAKLRVKRPLTDPPDCEFNGTMQMQGGHQSVRIGQRTTGVLCWAVDKYVLGRLFEASEPLENFLNRFDFHLLGEKLVGDAHYYLIQGKAKDPNKKNPAAMLGWIDYERGLVTDGRLEFDWGTVEAEQQYKQVNGSWVLTHQVVHSNRFEATLEVAYSNFRFAR